MKLVKESLEDKLQGPSKEEIMRELDSIEYPDEHDEIIEKLVEKGYTEIIPELMEKGFQVSGDAILNAVKNGDFKIVDLFFEDDPDFLDPDEWQDFNNSPWIFAVDAGNYKMLDHLLSKMNEEEVEELYNYANNELKFDPDDSYKKLIDYLELFNKT